MTKTDALQLVRYLCWRSKVDEPSEVTWTTRAVRGCYTMPIHRKLPRGRIACGPRAWISPEAQILHEVAHHICAMRSPKRQLTRRERRESRGLHVYGKVVHGPWFTETLIELAEHWHGDVTAYPWKDEYAGVAKWADRVLTQ